MSPSSSGKRVTLHEINGSSFSVGSVKRWLAVTGGLVVVGVLAAMLLLISFAIRETGNGANPDEAFSSTELDVGALRAEIAWASDAEDLVRQMEPSTREQLAIAWLRADDALARAAIGDTSGLDVWFVDAALANAEARFDRTGSDSSASDGRVSTAQSVAHRLAVDFYSLDGQVVVLGVDTIRARPTTDPIETGARTEIVERLEAVLVLSDGNWRIRHVERLTDTDLEILIET